MKTKKTKRPKLHTKKITVPFKNFIFIPNPVSEEEFQKQKDDVQDMIVEMILIGRGMRRMEGELKNQDSEQDSPELISE